MACSNTTNEYSTVGNLDEYFMGAADAKAVARAAPRREPQTILLEEREDAGEIREEGLPIPVQIGHRPGDNKRQLANAETIQLDKEDEIRKKLQELLPKPVKVGNRLFKCELPELNAIHSFADDPDTKRRLKRHLGNLYDGHDNDFDFDYGTTAKPATNK